MQSSHFLVHQLQCSVYKRLAKERTFIKIGTIKIANMVGEGPKSMARLAHKYFNLLSAESEGVSMTTFPRRDRFALETVLPLIPFPVSTPFLIMTQNFLVADDDFVGKVRDE